MQVQAITPILNVSSMEQSFAWFAKIGWEKAWDWGEPPTFGAVKSGHCEIFLCLDGQGHRLQAGEPPTGFVGVWMSIWVENVDEIHANCQAQGVEVTWPPTDEPWGVREMHIRHPDGHTFRISQSTDCDD